MLGGILLSLLASIIPTALYVLLLWWLDRYEKEPLPLFLAAFLWGTIPAITASFIGEVAAGLAGWMGTPGASPQIDVIAPLIEEACKAAALLLVYWLFRSEFDDVLDGIIYGSAIGFGFAMTENILYYVGAWLKGGVVVFTELVLVRGIAFGFNHAMYTALTGAALGYARLRRPERGRGLIFLLGYALAVLVHTLHNALVGQELCLLGFLLDWGGVLLLFLMVILSWRSERRIMSEYLQEEVQLGFMTQAQYDAIRRRRPAAGPCQAGGAARGRRLERDIRRTATELAFKKYQLAKMGDEGHNSRIINSLRRQLQELNHPERG